MLSNQKKRGAYLMKKRHFNLACLSVLLSGSLYAGTAAASLTITRDLTTLNPNSLHTLSPRIDKASADKDLAKDLTFNKDLKKDAKESAGDKEADLIAKDLAKDLSTGDHSASNIDRILSELSRQHDNASSLVKSARQPTALALNSPLIASRSGHADKPVDVLERLTAVASKTVSKFKQTGLASWYGRKFHGRKTASGETFDMHGLTAAHRSLPLNCYIKVTNKDNGKSVIVKVNDRGPFHGNRVLDLSYGAAKQIGLTQKGIGNVAIERVSSP